MTAREIAKKMCDEKCPVTLIYVRPAAGRGPASEDLLWRRASEVADRHLGEVELLDVESAPSALAGPSGASMLLVLRHGELVTEAIGPLPTAELERVVRRALG